MKWRTEILPLDYRGLLDLDSKIVTIGSCFADEIGIRLRNCFFDIDVNPLGTLFNPASIAQVIARCVNSHKFTTDDVCPTPEGEKWVSFHRHSRFSSSSAEELTGLLNSSQERTRGSLAEASVIILTLGSTRYFKHKSFGFAVANCHRFHPDTFEVIDMSVAEIVDSLCQTVEAIYAVNKSAKIILTVSPVRHIAYGLAHESLSKARLRVATDEFISQHCPDAIYFPAFEALNDDLRDYRFYADDLVHPSQAACDYIFNLFISSFVSKSLEGQTGSWRNIFHRCSLNNIDKASLINAAANLHPSEATMQRLLTKISQQAI